VDKRQLEQVLLNMYVNAWQAMPDGGELEISGERRNGQVVLRWRDTGVGMTEEVRRQAFEPFVTTQPGGSGLGLAVVYAAVADHGGTIAIDSVPGSGTTVTVELPGARAGA
jgi:signal transduction histidine kinase